MRAKIVIIGEIVLLCAGLILWPALLCLPTCITSHATSPFLGCVNNMRQIDSGKEQWAAAKEVMPGAPAATSGINIYIKGNTIPMCPEAGAYDYGPVGDDPRCSVHGVLSAPHMGPVERRNKRSAMMSSIAWIAIGLAVEATFLVLIIQRFIWLSRGGMRPTSAGDSPPHDGGRP